MRIFWVGVAIWAVAVRAVTYYVDSVGGNDGNSGVAPTAAWKTLSKASSAALGGGDSILLARGSVFEQQSLSVSSPSPAGQVTVGAYGERSPRRPRIEPGPTMVGIYVNNASSVRVEGVAVRGGWYGVRFALTGQNGPYEVRDCAFLSNVAPASAMNASQAGWWGGALAFGTISSLPGAYVRDVLVSDNVAADGDTFLRFSAVGVDALQASSNVTLERNAVANMSFNVVEMVRGELHTVRDSVFFKDTPRFLFEFGTTDIIVGSLDHTSAIRSTEFVARGESALGPDGCAIDFETQPVGFQVTDCFISDSYGAGVMVFGHPPANPEHVLIANNLFLRAGEKQTRNDHGGVAIMQANSSGTIANNTFYNNPPHPAIFPREPSFLLPFDIANNSIYNITQTTPLLPPPTISLTRNESGILVKAQTTDPAAYLTFSMDNTPPPITKTPDTPTFPPQGIFLTKTTALFVRQVRPDHVPSPSAGNVFVVQ